MTYLMNYIGQQALQNYFSQYPSQAQSYNPQYNGWDSPEDMPTYNVQVKNKQKYAQNIRKQGQKLNTQLVDNILQP